MNQRQIKFRVFDVEDQKIIYPKSFSFHDGFECWESDIYIGLSGKGKWSSSKKGDFLMQFTGLHDKNGKEIWEGDVLRESDFEYEWDCLCDTTKWDDDCNGSKECNQRNELIQKYGDLCVVEYNNNIGAFVFPPLSQDLRNFEDYWSVEDSFCYLEHRKHLEVIGNIFENPELVGDGE